MEMMEVLRTRRSVRKYEPRPISAEHRQLLTEALLRSPTSRNLRPWEFVFVDEPELLAKLAKTKPHGSSFVDGAALAIVVSAQEGKCDVWVEDCSIASIIVQLVATSLGLGSCWVQVRKRAHDDQQSAEAYVRELLGIPDDLQVLSIMAVGHPAERKAGVPYEKLEQSKIHQNRF